MDLCFFFEGLAWFAQHAEAMECENTTTFCIFLFLGWQEYPVLADWKQAGLWRQVCH